MVLYIVKRVVFPLSLMLTLAACGGTASVSSPPSGPATASASVSTASTKPAASVSVASPAKPAASTSSSPAASGQPAASLSAGPVVGNPFSVQATEYSFSAPDSLPGGLTTIRLTDTGKEPHEVQLFRLNSGVTTDQFQTALKNPNPAEVLKLTTADGGVAAVDPGGTAESVMDLLPGQYYLVCFLPDANGIPHLVHGMVKPLTVNQPAASASAVASPQAGATVTLKDFSFDMPATLPAGTTIVKVTNDGPQTHQMEVAKVAPGKTAQEVASFFANQPSGPPPSAAVAPAASGSAAASAAPPARPEASVSGKPQATPGPPPFQDLGGMNGLAKGESGWAVLNLTPGDYVALCAIPDAGGSLKPHVDLGMIMGI